MLHAPRLEMAAPTLRAHCLEVAVSELRAPCLEVAVPMPEGHWLVGAVGRVCGACSHCACRMWTGAGCATMWVEPRVWLSDEPMRLLSAGVCVRSCSI